MECRFNGYAKIGFFNRLCWYPTFAIVILDSTKLSQEEKQEFKEVILSRYLNDRKYRSSIKYKYIVFANGKLQGIYYISDIPSFTNGCMFCTVYPCVGNFSINTKRFWWE